jgi:hypothetical protein
MTISPTTHNRDIKFAVAEMSKRPNLMYFTLSDGVNIKELWVMLLSVGLVILATAGGFAAGWLIARDAPDRLAVAVLGGALAGYIGGRNVFLYLLTAAKASYEAEFGEDDRPTGRSFSRTARPGHIVPLSSNDKELLQVFARRYPVKRTLAVNEWEGADSPFVFDWLESKRAGIKRVQSLVIRHGFGTRDGRGGVTLNEAGEARIADWQNGSFGDVTELENGNAEN